MFDSPAIQQQGGLGQPDRMRSGARPMDMADLLVAYLDQIGIDYLFGIPGGAIEPLYDAIARHQRRGGNLSHVVARHEAGAAFMADGYARETGKIGVCLATSGPGATNMLTAVATSYTNDVPLLVITGQPSLASFGKHGLQESACTGMDVMSMFRSCTRYNSLVSHPMQLEWKLITALQHATRAPRGPAHLSVPLDVFRAASKNPAPTYDLTPLLRPSLLVDEGAVDCLRGMLAASRKTVLLIGGACGDAVDAVMQFAVRNNAAFVVTPDGKGLVSPQHPLYRGVFGFGGHAAAQEALTDPEADLILAVGSSMGEWNTGGWNASLLNERLVHIDESEEHLARTPMARFHLRGNPRAIFARLLERGAAPVAKAAPGGATPPAPAVPANAGGSAPSSAQERASLPQLAPKGILDDPEAYLSDEVPLKPQRLMRELGRLFPHGTRFLADAGNSVAWAAHYLEARERRQGERRAGERLGGDYPRELEQRRSQGGWLRLTSHFAPMGWAIGAAVGTAAANPSTPVVCITGDGSMLMSGQELSVAVAEQLCVIFVVLNDAALGMVKHGQRLGGGEPIAYALPPTDFALLARSLGGRAYTIHSPADLAALDIKSICNHPGPTLLDVHIDPEAVPPMNSRLRVLKEGA